jgi:hypothetical protein
MMGNPTDVMQRTAICHVERIEPKCQRCNAHGDAIACGAVTLPTGQREVLAIYIGIIG